MVIVLTWVICLSVCIWVLLMIFFSLKISSIYNNVLSFIPKKMWTKKRKSFFLNIYYFIFIKSVYIKCKACVFVYLCFLHALLPYLSDRQQTLRNHSTHPLGSRTSPFKKLEHLNSVTWFKTTNFKSLWGWFAYFKCA